MQWDENRNNCGLHIPLVWIASRIPDQSILITTTDKLRHIKLELSSVHVLYVHGLLRKYQTKKKTLRVYPSWLGQGSGGKDQSHARKILVTRQIPHTCWGSFSLRRFAVWVAAGLKGNCRDWESELLLAENQGAKSNLTKLDITARPPFGGFFFLIESNRASSTTFETHS